MEGAGPFTPIRRGSSSTQRALTVFGAGRLGTVVGLLNYYSLFNSKGGHGRNLGTIDILFLPAIHHRGFARGMGGSSCLTESLRFPRHDFVSWRDRDMDEGNRPSDCCDKSAEQLLFWLLGGRKEGAPYRNRCCCSWLEVIRQHCLIAIGQYDFSSSKNDCLCMSFLSFTLCVVVECLTFWVHLIVFWGKCRVLSVCLVEAIQLRPLATSVMV